MVVDLLEAIKGLLLRSSIGCRRRGCFRLQGAMHTLMTSVLLLMNKLWIGEWDELEAECLCLFV